jgi:signal transduction histidine kinase
MASHDKVNILMVDDQPSKLISYEAILSELDENLIKASSGREALDHLLRSDIAVVLLDVSMPDLDGFELADMIHQHPRFQKTALIFISAVHLTDLDRLRGYASGAVDYISVPVVPELLRAKVRVFAELHRKTGQLENLNRELRQLSSSLIMTQDEERRRIARELHDGLGQELSAAKMLSDQLLAQTHAVESAKQMAADISELIGRSIQQVRSLSHLLHPPLLDEVGLHFALRSYVEGLTKRSGVETSVDVKPADFPRFAPELETAIFRIIQEALTNVFRHAGARTAGVTLSIEGDQLHATVRDDGRGIAENVAEFRSDSIGMGIGGMVQRVKEFGGELRLRNLHPGTAVEVSIPIQTSSVPSPNPSLEREAAQQPVELNRTGRPP